jgi:hypothetical protein
MPEAVEQLPFLRAGGWPRKGTRVLFTAGLGQSTRAFWNADYLVERGIAPEPKAYAGWLERQEADRRRAAHDPDYIIAAFGDWHTKRPGVVEVITADQRHHFVTQAWYGLREGLNLLSKCELVHDMQTA